MANLTYGYFSHFIGNASLPQKDGHGAYWFTVTSDSGKRFEIRVEEAGG